MNFLTDSPTLPALIDQVGLRIETPTAPRPIFEAYKTAPDSG